MKLLALSLVFIPLIASANLKFSFKNDEITKMIETYSRATGQKFVIDPSVRGKGSITASDNVTPEEAFDLLSTVLAVNGYAVSKRDDVFVVMNARNAERDLIETTHTLPALKPQRLVTYVVTLKNASAADVMRELRMLSSKDGEVSAYTAGNQLIFTDWTSNLHHIDAMLHELDQPGHEAAPTKSSAKK